MTNQAEDPDSKAAREEERQAALRKILGDPEAYAERLRKRGAPKYEHPSWVRKKGKWYKAIVINPTLRASADVHDGTIKALTTPAVPERPTSGWLEKIDKNVAHDRRDKEALDTELKRALLASTILDEKVRLPAKRAGVPFDSENDDPDHAPAPQRVGNDPLEPGKYLPHPDAPHVPLQAPDWLKDEDRDRPAARARAASIREAVAKARVPDIVLAAAVARYGEGWTWDEIAKEMGAGSRQNAQQRVADAVTKIRKLGPGYQTVLAELKASRFEDFEKDAP